MADGADGLTGELFGAGHEEAGLFAFADHAGHLCDHDAGADLMVILIVDGGRGQMGIAFAWLASNW